MRSRAGAARRDPRRQELAAHGLSRTTNSRALITSPIRALPFRNAHARDAANGKFGLTLSLTLPSLRVCE
jgi:hypothetical protein